MIAQLTLFEYGGRPATAKETDVDKLWSGRLFADLEKDTLLCSGPKILQKFCSKMIATPTGKEGRNIFTSTRGYCGIGIFGRNHIGSEPVVQVGDKIAIFPGCSEPYIIRPCGENGEFRFIGSSYIPFMATDVSLRPENRLPLQEIHIR